MDCLDDLLIGADGGSWADVEAGTDVAEVGTMDIGKEGTEELIESKAAGEESEWREETWTGIGSVIEFEQVIDSSYVVIRVTKKSLPELEDARPSTLVIEVKGSEIKALLLIKGNMFLWKSTSLDMKTVFVDKSKTL